MAVHSLTGPLEAAITGTTFLGNVGVATTAVADPTAPSTFLIAGRSGTISRFDAATGVTTPFLTVPGVSSIGEGGIIGLALSPDYANDGYGYLYYTPLDFPGRIRSQIARFERDPSDPTRGLAGSVAPILSFSQPQSNHNAGWIGFSPNDSMLYIASGDGGGSDDNDSGHTPGIGNSLDITNNLLGKMLRIDVTGDDFPSDANRNYAIPADNPFVGVTGDDEIWTYGLRNPFRNGFDRETGDLWIADVGQNTREEINRQPGDSSGGENYGWRRREGTVATPSGGVGGSPPFGSVDPVYEYLHPGQPGADPELSGNSVTGGTVYRGPDASLDGLYFFADYAQSKYWTFDPADPDGTVDNITSDLFGSSGASSPVSFVEDTDGNLHVLTIGGNFYRIDTTPPGDYDSDGQVDSDDYVAWRDAYGSTTNLEADGNGDGVVDAADYTVWRDNLPDQGDSGAVPEPTSLVLAIGLGASVISSSSRRPPAA